MADRLILRGMSFFGFHGLHVEEKTLGQRFLVDLDLELDLAPAGRDDDLSRSVSYSDVYRAVRELVEGPSRNTLEALAESTAAELLLHFSLLSAVVIRIHKPGAPIKGAQFETVAVEIRRERQGPS